MKNIYKQSVGKSNEETLESVFLSSEDELNNQEIANRWNYHNSYLKAIKEKPESGLLNRFNFHL